MGTNEIYATLSEADGTLFGYVGALGSAVLAYMGIVHGKTYVGGSRDDFGYSPGTVLRGRPARMMGVVYAIGCGVILWILWQRAQRLSPPARATNPTAETRASH